MSSTPNVLYYVEAHPIRNSYMEHYHVCQMIAPVLARAAARDKINLRVFANHHVGEKIQEAMPGVARHLCLPTDVEAKRIDAEFGRWDEDRISRWVEMVQGKSHTSELYVSILERLHREQPIDVVFLWSENGGVRNFCEKYNIPILHGELGPTRAQFGETMYFDTMGTNGHAAFRTQARADIEASIKGLQQRQPTSARSWLLPSEHSLKDAENKQSLIDLPVTFHPEFLDDVPSEPYVFIALQLADDLNTLLHSPFKTPEAFLRTVLPEVYDHGYRAVIKGHPAAAARPYNLRKEVEALAYVETAFPDAIIMPRAANATRSTYALSNASYSMSINSSMSFESLLLGVPSVLKGDAAFDADGWMQKQMRLAAANNVPDFRTEINLLTSTYLEKILVPKNLVCNSDVLVNKLIELTAKNVPLEGLANFAHWYLFSDEFERDTEIPESLPSEVSSAFEDGALVIGNSAFLGCIKLHKSKNNAVLSDGKTSLSLGAPSTRFLGTIDDVKDVDGDLYVSGWCLDQNTMVPPTTFLLVSDEAIYPVRPRQVERFDVHEVFPAAEHAVTAGFEIKIPNILRKGKKVELLLLSTDLHYLSVSDLTAPSPIVQRTKRPQKRSVSAALKQLVAK